MRPWGPRQKKHQEKVTALEFGTVEKLTTCMEETLGCKSYQRKNLRPIIEIFYD